MPGCVGKVLEQGFTKDRNFQLDLQMGKRAKPQAGLGKGNNSRMGLEGSNYEEFFFGIPFLFAICKIHLANEVE
jgi:hypothetical protein